MYNEKIYITKEKKFTVNKRNYIFKMTQDYIIDLGGHYVCIIMNMKRDIIKHWSSCCGVPEFKLTNIILKEYINEAKRNLKY